MYSFAPEEESDGDRGVREANRAYCLSRIEEIQRFWRNCYEEHISIATKKAQEQLGEAKNVAERQLDFLRTLANSPPECDISDTNTLETAEAARMALKPEFSSLPKRQLRAIWVDAGHPGDNMTPPRRPHVTKSHLASVLGSTTKLVDVRYVICKHCLAL